MCIICNMGGIENTKGHEAADMYLGIFAQASAAIKEAERWMLECSKLAVDGDVRKQYDTIHKRMVHFRKEWNKLEQQREHVPLPPAT